MQSLTALRQSLWKGVKIALGAGVVTYTLRRTVADVVKLQGASMEPTLSAEDDVVLCERLTPHSELSVGDIVVFNSPTHPGTLYCKRIVGLTGTPYSIATPTPFGLVTSERRIPQGHVWVEGDNKAKSVDSRVFGPIPTGLIEGRVCARIWPPSRMQVIEKHKELFPPYPLLCLHPALAERVRLKGVPPPSPTVRDAASPEAIFHFMAPSDLDATLPKLGDLLPFSDKSPLDETERILEAVRQIVEAPSAQDRPFAFAPLPFRVMLNRVPLSPTESKSMLDESNTSSPVVTLVDSPPLTRIDAGVMGSPSPITPDPLSVDSIPIPTPPHSISNADRVSKLLDQAVRRQQQREEIHRHVAGLNTSEVDAMISAVLDADPGHNWSAKSGPVVAIPDVDKLRTEDLFDPAASFSSGAMVKRAKEKERPSSQNAISPDKWK